jgi:hypothetical protein
VGAKHIKKLEWAVNATTVREVTNSYRISATKSERKSLFGRRGCRYEDNSKSDHKEIRAWVLV